MSAPYRFDRYRNGRLMAEGIKVNKENCLEDAIRVAARLADHGDVLVYDVALDAMLAKAREDALREAAEVVNRNIGKPAHHAHGAILALIEREALPKPKKPNLIGTGVQVGLLKKNPGS